MKFVKTLIAVAVTACAVNANAGLSFSQMAAVGPLVGGALTFSTSSGIVNLSTYGNSAGQLVPNGLSLAAQYSVIGNGGSAVLSFGTMPVTSFSFLWGSPDRFNSIDIATNDQPVMTYTGTDLALLAGFSADGSNANTRIFSIAGTAATSINTITFRSTGNAFEVAAVPEPETYALMLAGLGAVGFMARRRRAA